MYDTITNENGVNKSLAWLPTLIYNKNYSLKIGTKINFHSEANFSLNCSNYIFSSPIYVVHWYLLTWKGGIYTLNMKHRLCHWFLQMICYLFRSVKKTPQQLFFLPPSHFCKGGITAICTFTMELWNVGLSHVCAIRVNSS